MMTTKSLTSATAKVGQAKELLHNLEEEEYRFFSTLDGGIIRPAGAYPKQRPSEYAHIDARALQDVLMQSIDVRSLVSVASNMGYSLHLLDVTDEGEVEFAKEKPGVLYGEVEHVTAKL